MPEKGWLNRRDKQTLFANVLSSISASKMVTAKSDSQKNTEAWENINWKKAQQYVYRLQKRIYSASHHGDWQRLRKLQKTLIRSWYGRLVAVKRVTQDNRKKSTVGIDGGKNLTPSQKINLALHLKLTEKSEYTPVKVRKSSARISIMYDKALQALIKLALEPEWNAKSKPIATKSYYFKPSPSCHEVLNDLRTSLLTQTKYVLHTDISRCFDRINHAKLLDKLKLQGKIRKQIKIWLKSEALDDSLEENTDVDILRQDCPSLLLTNMVLGYLEEKLLQWSGCVEFPTDEKTSFTLIRYGNNFIILHEEKWIVLQAELVIKQFLGEMGLKVNGAKTRIAHTFNGNESEDGKPGFNFLGHHVRQFPVKKYNNSIYGGNYHTNIGKSPDFDLIINPSKQAIKTHMDEIRKVLQSCAYSPQEELILKLNPIIRDWCNYYRFSDAQTTGVFKHVSHTMFLMIRKWGKRRCGNFNKARQLYFKTVGTNNWIFSGSKVMLITHKDYFTRVAERILVSY